MANKQNELDNIENERNQALFELNKLNAKLEKNKKEIAQLTENKLQIENKLNDMDKKLLEMMIEKENLKKKLENIQVNISKKGCWDKKEWKEKGGNFSANSLQLNVNGVLFFLF